jgi:hypothetical protein
VVPPPAVPEGKKEACKTYVEQTKLLVTLASAFLVAPVAVFGLLRGQARVITATRELWFFGGSEFCFVVSVLLGYAVLGTLAGSQDEGEFDVYRRATQVLSLLQISAYIGGLALLGWLCVSMVSAEPAKADGVEPRKFSLVSVGEIGPFTPGEGCQERVGDDPASEAASVEIRKLGQRVVAIIVSGSADVAMLRPSLRKAYGTNAGLASARAECVKRVLEAKLGSGAERAIVISAARGPAYIGDRVREEDRRKDRTVRVFVVGAD